MAMLPHRRSRPPRIEAPAAPSYWSPSSVSPVASSAVHEKVPAGGTPAYPVNEGFRRTVTESRSGDRVAAQALQHRDLTRDARSKLPAVDDHVDGSGLQQELGALEALGQLLADGVLDHARPGESDQRLGLGDHHVADEREA